MAVADPPETEQTKADVSRWVTALDEAVAELRAEIARQLGEQK